MESNDPGWLKKIATISLKNGFEGIIIFVILYDVRTLAFQQLKRTPVKYDCYTQFVFETYQLQTVRSAIVGDSLLTELSFTDCVHKLHQIAGAALCLCVSGTSAE